MSRYNKYITMPPSLSMKYIISISNNHFFILLGGYFLNINNDICIAMCYQFDTNIYKALSI